ncbi:MAG: hypothetical protein IJ418_03240 [Clostridia bacterium]|nr:hypothetical protein [Clostridia bacterium]
MSDIFNENQSAPVDENQQTRVMPPVEDKPTTRRRRTERNRDAYENAEVKQEAAKPAEQPKVEEKPAAAPAFARKNDAKVEQTTTAVPAFARKSDAKAEQKTAAPSFARPAAAKVETQAHPSFARPTEKKPDAKAEQADGTAVVPRFQTKYAPPSQAVPRPAVLSDQAVRRPAQPQPNTTIRRPVNAEGYSPIQPLGTAKQQKNEKTAANGASMRRPVPQMQPVEPAADVQGEQNEKTGAKWLVPVIIVLLVLAVAIVGLLLIPDDADGVLSQIKQTVTAPLQGLLGGDEDEKTAVPAQASGFSATLAQDTAPYKIVFSLVTSGNVTGVRVVDAQGNPMPTTTNLSTPNTDSTIVWMMEMTLETGYEGTVQAQIQDGENWIDTGLQQTLTIGGDVPPTISSAPVNTAAVSTDVPDNTADPMTADSDVESTVNPIVEETETPTDEPTATPEAVPVAEIEPTDVPEAEPTQEQPAVTATPTMAVTPTPTIVPTPTPTLEPTEEPTATPTAEPTATPTVEPTATPVVTPRLEAQAAEGADPSLIRTTVVYEGTKKVDEYERDEDELINMPAGDDYLTRQFGVTTYRGNAFRQNGAVGTVTNPTSMSIQWTVEASSVKTKSRTFYGIGWTGQAAIINWPKNVRQLMDIDESRINQSAMKEVIIAGQDGVIYFLDLNDGTTTREAINLGYPMRGTPAVHPLGYPLMIVGQYSRFLPNKSGDIGLHYYDLLTGKKTYFLDGLDGDADRQYNNVGAFDTSALIDRNSDTLIAIGTNGLLYTEKLNTEMAANNGGTLEINPEQVAMKSYTKGQKEARAAVESSPAAYGSYVFYADLDGILRCVDTTTMQTMWAVDTDDAVKASIALDLDEETNTLWLYTCNTLINRSKGDVTIRRFNAMTGEEDWAFALNSKKDTKKDTITGAMASPVIGQKGLEDYVYFTLSNLSASGSEKLLGDGADALSGVVIALNKESGEVAWTKAMDAYCYSSPVAVYDAEGKGWLIQASSTGLIYLMDGLTGETINTLQVTGTIEGSPAVYGDTMVIGTTGKDTSFIYGIKLK